MTGYACQETAEGKTAPLAPATWLPLVTSHGVAFQIRQSGPDGLHLRVVTEEKSNPRLRNLRAWCNPANAAASRATGTHNIPVSLATACEANNRAANTPTTTIAGATDMNTRNIRLIV